jgi:hypothetical protein
MLAPKRRATEGSREDGRHSCAPLHGNGHRLTSSGEAGEHLTDGVWLGIAASILARASSMRSCLACATSIDECWFTAAVLIALVADEGLFAHYK